MRRLIVMRHAKSSWKTGHPDHERPLNKRGRSDAPRIAQRLVQLGWVPDFALSSDSTRTTETWSLMSDAFEGATVHFSRSLYGGGIGDIQAAARSVPDEVGTLLVLGHNPGWEDAASWLSGESISMTTANAVLLEGEGATWADALQGQWRLETVLRPREL